MVLAQQKVSYNRQAGTRKQKIYKEIHAINDKIKALTATVEKHNKITDIEQIITTAETTEQDRPQGLKVEV